jgi:ketosteroid isomerase-like protein
MKRFHFVVPLAIFTALVCGWVFAAAADDKQVISDLEHKLATVTTGDEAMKYFDTGDDVVLFDMMGPPREFAGRKAILIHDHTDEFSRYTDLKVDFLELKVMSDGKLALVRSVQHLTAKDADGKPVDITFRVTDLWRKTHGQWKLILAHDSVPVDMKTGKADMASKM